MGLMRDARGLPKLALDSTFWSSPRFAGASLRALGLHVAGVGYSYRHELDGVLPGDTKRLAGALGLQQPDVEDALAELLDAGAWRAEGVDVVIVEYELDHPTRAEISDRREHKKRAAISMNHKRWHAEERHDDCPLCQSAPDTLHDAAADTLHDHTNVTEHDTPNVTHNESSADTSSETTGESRAEQSMGEQSTDVVEHDDPLPERIRAYFAETVPAADVDKLLGLPPDHLAAAFDECEQRGERWPSWVRDRVHELERNGSGKAPPTGDDRTAAAQHALITNRSLPPCPTCNRAKHVIRDGVAVRCPTCDGRGVAAHEDVA